MIQSRSTRTSAFLAVSAIALAALSGCNRSQNGQAAGGASGAAYADSGYVVGSGANSPVAPAQAPRREYARYAPPPIPTYDQPPPPGEGYMWTPGYWGWSDQDEDYYWVPGAWIEPPDPGVYWTPGYWAFVDDEYVWSPGFWAPSVGFYGGIDYGWGYGGRGYYGGRWQDGRFYYNAALNNLGPGQAQYVYRDPRPAWGRDHASYNGGPGGVRAAPAPADEAALAARRLAPTRMQASQAQLARQTQGLRASANHGAPPIVAVSRAGDFRGAGVVTHVRSAGHYNPPPRQAPAGGPPGHAVAPGGAPIGGHGGLRGNAGPAADARAPGFHGPATERAAELHGGFQAPAARVETPHAAAARPAPAFHGAPERAAPAFHAAPQRAAPAFHAAPERAAPAFHPAPERAAPAVHAAPERAAPAFHAPPAVHAAPAPRPAAPAPAHGGGDDRRPH